jgi:hypothetical protein
LRKDGAQTKDATYFDAGYGEATAIVFEDSLVISIPMDATPIKSCGTMHEICSLNLIVGDSLYTVVVSDFYETDQYTVQIWRRWIPPRNMCVNEEPRYHENDDVAARYDTSFRIIFGPDWASRVRTHRPETVPAFGMCNKSDPIPIYYVADNNLPN